MTPAQRKALPYPELMKRRLRTFAMLDAILAPDARSFEWHPKWGRGEEVGAFKDGEGNHVFVWFTKKGAVLLGFDHESALSPFRGRGDGGSNGIWAPMWDGLPKELVKATKEPAFGGDELTFACWARGATGPWMSTPARPPKADGAKRLLFGCFSKNARKWASAYYDMPIDGPAMNRLWNHQPLDVGTLRALTSDLDMKAVREEAKFLGWPLDERTPSTPPKLEKKKTHAAAPPPKRARPLGQMGEAAFVVQCLPDRVRMTIHDGRQVVAQTHVDVYEELFDLVKARIRAAARSAGARGRR